MPKTTLLSRATATCLASYAATLFACGAPHDERAASTASASTTAAFTPPTACNPPPPAPPPTPPPPPLPPPPYIPPPPSVGVLWDWHNSPLVFDFCGRPISYLGHGVPFDLFGDGTQPLLDWIAPSFAFLALPDASGRITSGAQLFGTETPLSCGALANNGFLALAQYDDDLDGLITSADSVFGRLVLWFDLNSDGVAQASEQLTLAQAGMEWISLTYTAEDAPDADVSYIGYTGTFGSTYANGQVADVYFPTSTDAPATPAHGTCPAVPRAPAECLTSWQALESRGGICEPPTITASWVGDGCAGTTGWFIQGTNFEEGDPASNGLGATNGPTALGAQTQSSWNTVTSNLLCTTVYAGYEYVWFGKTIYVQNPDGQKSNSVVVQDQLGDCGSGCPSGLACVSGSCKAPCPAGETLCGAGCVNTQTDTNNCGGCGNICMSCNAGVCGWYNGPSW